MRPVRWNRVLLLPLVVMCVLTLVSINAVADTETGSYDLTVGLDFPSWPPQVPRVSVLGLQLPPDQFRGMFCWDYPHSVCNNTGVNIGGHEFGAQGVNEVPNHVQVLDATGTPVGFTVCQDGPLRDGRCGGTGEAIVNGCGDADLSTSVQPWNRTLEVFVFVYAYDSDCPSGVGTRGTIELTYENVQS